MNVHRYPWNLVYDALSRGTEINEDLVVMNKACVTDAEADETIMRLCNLLLARNEKTALIGRYKDDKTFATIAKEIGESASFARNCCERALTIIGSKMLYSHLFIDKDGKELRDMETKNLTKLLLPDYRKVLLILNKHGIYTIEDLYERCRGTAFIYSITGFGAEKRRMLMAALAADDYPLKPIFTSTDIMNWRIGETKDVGITAIPTISEYPTGEADIDIKLTLDVTSAPDLLKVVQEAFQGAEDNLTPAIDPAVTAKLLEIALKNYKDLNGLV